MTKPFEQTLSECLEAARVELTALRAEHARLREAAKRVSANNYVWSEETKRYLRAALDASPAEPEAKHETFDPELVRALLECWDGYLDSMDTFPGPQLDAAFALVRNSERKL